PYQPRENNREGGFERKPWQDRSQGGGSDRPYQPRDNNRSGGGFERKPWQDRSQGGGGFDRKPFNKSGGGGFKKPFGRKPRRDEFFVERKPKPALPSGTGMPLNKYLAHCGLSSRRKAVEYVDQGLVTVNGEVKTEPYYRMQPGDVVVCAGKLVSIQERTIYVLLNKPKNVITTTEDEHGRTTVMDIVDPHFPERIYPVGRLDRDTTGLLLLTNDGELAQKLSHPSHSVQKQYRIGLRKPLTPADFERIEQGIELEDGLVEVNWIRFSEDHPERDIVELEISVGRNRIVRRIFESLGYEVFKLDRFYFAGLTKKELQRGAFRELTQREIIMLKHFTGHPASSNKRDLLEETHSDELTETPAKPVVEAKMEKAEPAAATEESTVKAKAKKNKATEDAPAEPPEEPVVKAKAKKAKVTEEEAPAEPAEEPVVEAKAKKSKAAAETEKPVAKVPAKKAKATEEAATEPTGEVKAKKPRATKAKAGKTDDAGSDV
ncbi:MAG: pseudouridine synthase, partial [Saprospiraceae bacterium]